MNIWIIALAPALCSLMAFFKKRWLLHLTAFVNTSLLIYVIYLAVLVSRVKTLSPAGGFFYLDSLSMIFILVVSSVSTLVSFFAVSYFGRELDHGILTEAKLSEYHFWVNLLVAAMNLVVITPNLGIMWIAIEATTITSVLLVGFDNQKSSIEAAWKYVLICSVGIIFALIGIMLLHFSAIPLVGTSGASLDLRKLMTVAPGLNKDLLKVAFIFVLIGFGTKAGFAPLHTWLPDAHSQAPTPISALLSGVLLNCAFYGIIRVSIVTGVAVGTGFVHQFLTFFGLVSLGLAIPFILIQTDLKRLLAYSSVENMGVIAFAFGMGGKWGITGGLLQVVYHGLIKAGLFLTAGEVTELYRSKKINKMKGLFKLAPVLGIIFFGGFLVLSGAPPFAIFFSKMTIIFAGFNRGQIAPTVFFLIFMMLIFYGLFHHFSQITLGRPPGKLVDRFKDVKPWIVLIIPFIILIVFSFYQPEVWRILIAEAARIAGGNLK